MGNKVFVRTSTYDLHDNGRVTILGTLDTKNYLYTFKKEGWEVEDFEPPEHLLWKSGLEDGRLFKWLGEEWVLFSACSQVNPNKWEVISRNTMVLMHLNSKEWVPLHTDTKREKNWMPLVRGDELFFLYSTSPWVVLNQRAEVELSSPGTGKKWSGSSCFIPFEGKFLGVVHRRQNKRVYEHAFILVNEDLTFNRISKPFYFHKPQIEFCAGLDQRGDKFYLSYGIMDREAWISEVEKNVILELLE